jgi:hypothetical protein
VAEEELTDIVKNVVKLWVGFICFRIYNSYEEF